MKQRWKVYRRVLLAGELPKGANLQLTKQGLSAAPGFVGVYNWNTTIEAETGEEAELLMHARLSSMLEPYGIKYSTTKTLLLPAESITCPRCQMTSYHPTDIREGYCRNCHEFTGKPG